MTIDITVLALAIAVVVLIVVYGLRTGVAPMPTSPKVRAAIMALVPDGFHGPIVEMGSGWGTLAFAFARTYPACPVIAYELSPVPWLFSKLRHGARPLPNLTLHRGDFMDAELAHAGLVVCYLYPGGMEGIRTKLEADLAPGALVLSNTFAVAGWRPLAVGEADDLYRSKVYLYRMPQAVAISQDP